ncbi:MAG: hypothetical protein IPN62_16660 [Flavobacteriales bacterium]|nr:hypothetical protein [Flavobacteriales bacterium]
MNHSVRTLLLLSGRVIGLRGPWPRGLRGYAGQCAQASPGKERATKLVELSAHERSTGHYKEAIEFAILGSSEAERHGLDNELGQALMELARAHRSKGDLDNAIGASLRATLVNGTYHSGSRTEALLQLAELYVSAGHPRKHWNTGGCQEHNSRRPDGPHALPAYRNGCQGHDPEPGQTRGTLQQVHGRSRSQR